MAVWAQIIGLRQSKSIENDKIRLLEIFKNHQLSLIKSRVSHSNSIWKLSENRGVSYFELEFFEESLKIYFDNPNFIEFSGSFLLFSSWFSFVDPNKSELTNEICAVFRKIAFDLGISELIYFSEWFFSLDDIRNKEETFKDLENTIKENADRKSNELFGCKSNEYFIEKVQ